MNFIMKKQMEMKKQSKKGFTLVEVIVVIVIIAILAGIAVPALTGYIERAKTRAAMTDAKNIATALQTIVVESFANGAREYGHINLTPKPGNGPNDGKVRIRGAYGASGTQFSDKTYLETLNELIGANYTAANFKEIISTGTYRDARFSSTGSGGSASRSILEKFIYVSNDGIEIEYTNTGGFKRLN